MDSALQLRVVSVDNIVNRRFESVHIRGLRFCWVVRREISVEYDD